MGKSGNNRAAVSLTQLPVFGTKTVNKDVRQMMGESDAFPVSCGGRLFLSICKR